MVVTAQIVEGQRHLLRADGRFDAGDIEAVKAIARHARTGSGSRSCVEPRANRRRSRSRRGSWRSFPTVE